MINLLKNEFIKVVKRPATICMVIIIIITSICCVYINKKTNIEYDDIDENWEQEILIQIEAGNNELKNEMLTKEQKDAINYDISWYQMLLTLKIKPSDWRRIPMSEYRNFCLANDINSDEAKKLKNIIEQDDWKSYFRSQDEEKKRELSRTDIKPYEREQVELDLEISELRYKYDVKPCLGSEWKNDTVVEYSVLKSNLLGNKYFPNNSDYKLTQEQKKEKENQAEMCLYRIKNNIKDNEPISLAGYLSLYTISSEILLAFLVYMFSYIFYIEYKNNTIKQLVISKYPRRKIYISKLLSVCVVAFIFVLLQFLISLIAGSIIYNGELHPKLIIVNNSVISINFIVYILLKYFLIFINILCYAFFAQMITIFVKSAIFGIVLPLCINFLINPLAAYLSAQYKFNFVKYLPSASFDLTQFLDGEVTISGIHLTSSLITIIIWLFCCIAIGNYFFKNDEV